MGFSLSRSLLMNRGWKEMVVWVRTVKAGLIVGFPGRDHAPPKFPRGRSKEPGLVRPGDHLGGKEAWEGLGFGSMPEMARPCSEGVT